MKFSEILNDLLLERGKSKMDLSNEAGIPYTTICGWINAGRLPDYNAIIKLAKYFEVTTDYLLGTETEYGEKEQGEAPQYPTDEQILLRAYRAMTPGKKKALFQMLDLDENIIQQSKKA